MTTHTLMIMKRYMFYGISVFFPPKNKVWVKRCFFYLSNLLSPSSPHQIIVFDRVKTNIGNAYNAHMGIFIAARSGINANYCMKIMALTQYI